MREPNFSESQLQQSVNSALVRYIFEVRQKWASAVVPSLVAENVLGWDTAFYFPWLAQQPNSDHEGCNIFFQYKLSNEMTSPGAREWEHWNCPYLRFKIPHRSQDPVSLHYIDDYHQWVQLKKLSDDGYPTFYSTNPMLEKSELHSYYKSGTLLDNIPLLDVNSITSQHKHVTFTPSSTEFILHSEKAHSSKRRFSDVLGEFTNKKGRPISTLNKRLLSTLSEMPYKDKWWSEDLGMIMKPHTSDPIKKHDQWLQHVLITLFVRKHLGVFMLWVPTGAN